MWHHIRELVTETNSLQIFSNISHVYYIPDSYGKSLTMECSLSIRIQADDICDVAQH